MFVFSLIPILFTILYFNQVVWKFYSILILPIFIFIFLVNAYQKRRLHLLHIEKTLNFIKKEINRKEGNVKLLGGSESWEYDESIRNHPLSIDLDLCSKQGLFPYLDTTISKEAWKLFQEQLLQISTVSSRVEQEKIKRIVKNKSYTYQLLRKSLLFHSDSNDKIHIHFPHQTSSFWKNRKILKVAFPFLSIITPIWLLITWIFTLPFAPLLLLLNLILFVTYRKDSSRIWNQIRSFTSSIEIFEKAWIRMDVRNRKNISDMALDMRKLGNSSEWIVSPIPHIVLNVLFLWDLWKVNGFLNWERRYALQWESLRSNWISLEASLPIANFAFLHPNFTFPEWNDSKSFSAKQLSHPLLNENTRVDNKLPSMRPGDLMIITGSNMSGKTTYLRSIAVNLLLAGVGGPICGQAMTMIDFKIHTLIRSQDSLENGISFFYSEVRRLAEIIRNTSAAKEISVLFLDEIIKGTNSRERQIATREILNALQEKGAIVFLTTHDLELAETNDANLYHFTELEENGEMTFDYQIRDGISRSTNALKILKKEGIPIRDNIN